MSPSSTQPPASTRARAAGLDRRTRPAAGSCPARPGRAGGADLLPVPRAVAPADLGRPPSHPRASPPRLRPHGRFAWNAFAFDHQIPRAWTATPQTPIGAHDPVRRRRQCGRHHPRRRRVGSLWWATKNEWLGLLDTADLELEALYGGFAREPFTDDSREYVFVTRRRRSSDLPLQTLRTRSSERRTDPRARPYASVATTRGQDSLRAAGRCDSIRHLRSDATWENGS